MKTKLITLIITVLSLGRLGAQPSNDGSVNVESVDIFFAVAEKLMAGETVGQEQWDQLTSSPGYAIICNHFGNRLITDCIELAYDDRLADQRESIFAEEEDDWRMFVAAIVGNLYDMRGHWDEIKQFRADFDFDGLKDKSVAYLKEFLIHPVDSLVKFQCVNFLCFDWNGRKLDMGITMDLNLAYSKTEEGLVRFLAHEMFHEYRSHFVNNWLVNSDPALYGLSLLQNEGIADLVDKDTPEGPVEDPSIPQVVVEMYMDAFRNTPSILREFDQNTVQYLNGHLDDDEYGSRVLDLINFDGHANGHYMTRLIQREGFMPELLSDVGDPLVFARAYNKAAEAAGEYVFSREFMEHIENAVNSFYN